jgi:hypothetical protein
MFLIILKRRKHRTMNKNLKEGKRKYVDLSPIKINLLSS